VADEDSLDYLREFLKELLGVLMTVQTTGTLPNDAYEADLVSGFLPGPSGW